MCVCTPEIRTPFCGKPGCEWPHQKKKPPARALRLTIAIEADTSADMALALRNLACRVERDQVTTGMWGSPSDGAIYELLTDPTMTHDAYHAALRQYLDSRLTTPTTKD